jgi:hypothetical protein
MKCRAALNVLKAHRRRNGANVGERKLSRSPLFISRISGDFGLGNTISAGFPLNPDHCGIYLGMRLTRPLKPAQLTMFGTYFRPLVEFDDVEDS